MKHYIDLKSFSIEVVIPTQGESLKLVVTPIKLKKKKMNSNKKNFVL
jgi:hypothetical protein